ncbi:MAG: hypothetical protein ACKPE6_13210, partial [Gammaproteobacteria bacterium]
DESRVAVDRDAAHQFVAGHQQADFHAVSSGAFGLPQGVTCLSQRAGSLRRSIVYHAPDLIE